MSSKYYFIFCCCHCYLGCLFRLMDLFIYLSFSNLIIIKAVWVKKCLKFPSLKCPTSHFTNLNRIYKAHQTNFWWAMKVFHLCWLKSSTSAYTLVIICMILHYLAQGKDRYHVFTVCSSILCDTRCHPLRSGPLYHMVFTWQTTVLEGTVWISKHT